MHYNYLRFDNVFEFGQSYQITSYDQTNIFRQIRIEDVVLKSFDYLFLLQLPNNIFPYIFENGIFFNYPILFSIFFILKKSVRDNLKQKKLFNLIIFIIVSSLLINLADSISCPNINERYRMDIYFLFCIASFIIIASFFEISKWKSNNLAFCLSVITEISLLYGLLIYLAPNNYNSTIYFNEFRLKIKHLLSLGFK